MLRKKRNKGIKLEIPGFWGSRDPGNGHNDRLLLEAVRSGGGLCIAVENGEGCAVDVIIHAHVFIHGAAKALNLLLNPDVCAAALRY